MSYLALSVAAWQRMVLSAVLVVVLMLSFTACAGSMSTSTPTPQPDAKPSGPIEAKWIEPRVDGDNVLTPESEVANDWNIHFKVDTSDGSMSFMAYSLDKEIYVRANVCPPCRSIGYSLSGNTIVCDRCATTFKARTGDGIKGACVDYPKAPVPYKITGGNIVMGKADLIAAYQNTLKPGWP